jgi:hypothetical protein
VGREVDVLILEAPPTDVASQAAHYAAGLHPTLGPAYAAELDARARHLESLGVRALVPTLTVVARRSPPPFEAVVPIQPFSAIHVDGGGIDRVLAGFALCLDPARLAAAKLRAPEGIVLTQRQVGPGAEVPSTLHASFPVNVGARPVDLDVEMLAVMTAVHESPSVAAGVALCAEQLGVSLETARDPLLARVGEALCQGLLQIAG